MSTWARHLDDLAAATAQLLIDGSVQPQPLVDPNAAMAARDAVLVELRQLIGSIGDAPRFATVRELTLHDVVHRLGAGSAPDAVRAATRGAVRDRRTRRSR